MLTSDLASDVDECCALTSDISTPAIYPTVNMNIDNRAQIYIYIYESMSMETAMARATKTTRSRGGAAAVVISVTIKPDLLNRLDAWCASRLPPATRSAAIAAAVERLLAVV